MAIIVGSQVTWTHVSQRGKTLSLKTKSGTVEGIAGDMATVITGRNNRRVPVPLKALREQGQRTHLTDVVEGFMEAHRERVTSPS